MTIAELRDEARTLLAPLADLAAPVAPGAEAPYDQLVRITDHQVDRASECGASLAYDGPFDGWRAAFARKRIGREVLERMRKGAMLDPSALARSIVAEMAADGRDGLGRWLGELGSGGRAAVVREAATFAAAARGELRQWPPADGTRFGMTWAWDLPGRAVRLETTVDAVTKPTRSLLVTARAASREIDVAWPALVATLASGQRVATVTRIELVTGDRWTVPVTDDVLDSGLTLAARAVEAAMAARFTSPMTPTPGRWCRWCSGRAICPVAQPSRPTSPNAPPRSA